MCVSICEDSFINIYKQFDDFGSRMVEILNKSSVELSHELKEIVDEMSTALLDKVKLNVVMISQQHARLEATSRIVEELLQNEPVATIEFVERHVRQGMSWYQFIGLCCIAFCIGINIETIRIRYEN